MLGTSQLFFIFFFFLHNDFDKLNFVFLTKYKFNDLKDKRWRHRCIKNNIVHCHIILNNIIYIVGIYRGIYLIYHFSFFQITYNDLNNLPNYL